MFDFNSSDIDTLADGINNQPSDHDDLINMESSSSPLLQPNPNVAGVTFVVQSSSQRAEEQTVVDQHETIPTTNNKHSKSNAK